jgi:multidrug resistance efflux pump
MTISLKDACDALDKAREAHVKATKEEDAIMKTTSSTLNALNQAQKDVDDAVNELRKSNSLWNSRWHSRPKGEPV